MTHPDFRQATIEEQGRTLQRVTRGSRIRAAAEPRAPRADDEVILRLCSVHDDDALGRLAAMEGRPAPRGRFVVAEVDGTVIAAVPVVGGEPLADPFRATAHLLPLLAMRAEQILVGRARRPRQPLRRRAWIWGRA